jgi:hypothetical protein
MGVTDACLIASCLVLVDRNRPCGGKMWIDKCVLMAKREWIKCGAKRFVVVIQFASRILGLLRFCARNVGIQRCLQSEDDEDE